MPEITLRGSRLEYEVRRSSRATRSRIEVKPTGVTVTVPDGSDLEPEKFLRERQDWVLEKWGAVQEYLASLPDREFAEGGVIPVLGEEHEIRITGGEKGVRDGEIRIPKRSVNKGGIRNAVEKLLREEARERVHAFLWKHQDDIAGEYGTVYIRNQRTKWASCSGKNNLSFNWRLVLGPPEVLEYVVVHELVHLEERNHSKRFWRRVEDVLPDFRERREWLRNNRHRLVFSEQDA